MTEVMSNWLPRQSPTRIVTKGQYVEIVPLNVEDHAYELFEAAQTADADVKHTWLPEQAPTDFEMFRLWVKTRVESKDPIFYAVIDNGSGKVGGRQSLMRIDTDNGVVEIGNIYWGPLISRSRGATEALYLTAKYVFDDLGYRRFEWKCNNDNIPSKLAAERFGFQLEGIFRQHLIVKGLNRDTAWFSIIDKDWPKLRSAYEIWLNPSNFDSIGNQKKRLQDCI